MQSLISHTTYPAHIMLSTILMFTRVDKYQRKHRLLSMSGTVAFFKFVEGEVLCSVTKN